MTESMHVQGQDIVIFLPTNDDSRIDTKDAQL